LTGDCDSFFNTWAFPIISATSSFPASSALTKPDPEIFRRALNLIDLKANEVLHVGDDPERDGKQQRRLACWSFGWTDQGIRCAIC